MSLTFGISEIDSVERIRYSVSFLTHSLSGPVWDDRVYMYRQRNVSALAEADLRQTRASPVRESILRRPKVLAATPLI